MCLAGKKKKQAKDLQTLIKPPGITTQVKHQKIKYHHLVLCILLGEGPAGTIKPSGMTTRGEAPEYQIPPDKNIKI